MSDISSGKKARKPKGEGSLFQRSSDGLWVFQFRRNGVRLTEYIVATDEKKAQKEAKRIRERMIGEFAREEHSPKTKANATVDDILDLYIDHLQSSTKTWANTKLVIDANLRPFFLGRKAASITTTDLKRYRDKRLADGRKPATIKNELSYLRAAMYRAKDEETPALIVSVPAFPKLRLDNIREGFVEEKDADLILKHLPDSLKPLFVIAYHVGCRKGELLSIRWSQVQFDDGFIVLRTGETKNDVGRHLPIYGDMRQALLRQKKYRDEHHPECDHVFFWHDVDVAVGHGGSRVAPGSPIRDFDGSWSKAVTAAGYPDLLFHDLRRSAVRNMVQKAKLPETLAMKISGHKTASMLHRYNIIGRTDIEEAGKQLDEWKRSQHKLQSSYSRPTAQK